MNKICGASLHINSISVDHIKRKVDGGLGTLDNAQLTHPFCNTTVKN
ncbi:HNH endonuclease [Nostoc sp. CENA67]|uniref:HNH endonuclease n=1 Tax=Amazonocrinis nigriterrae CENA67 TaxID=2794033 RepID=A0A8J7HSI6_9NOST|nr:HNH endonuclease signature motif containing protein [Amazonocrinis nigriterrae]MBH8564682.1 HNH endonuclease [Amazonocrinis nigriterrae CENA67]